MNDSSQLFSVKAWKGWPVEPFSCWIYKQKAVRWWKILIWKLSSPISSLIMKRTLWVIKKWSRFYSLRRGLDQVTCCKVSASGSGWKLIHLVTCGLKSQSLSSLSAAVGLLSHRRRFHHLMGLCVMWRMETHLCCLQTRSRAQNAHCSVNVWSMMNAYGEVMDKENALTHLWRGGGVLLCLRLILAS